MTEVEFGVSALALIESFDRSYGTLLLVPSSDETKQPYPVSYVAGEYWVCACKSFIYRDADCKHIKMAKKFLDDPYAEDELGNGRGN